MTAFVIVGGLFIAGALLFILPPLLRRGTDGGVIQAGGGQAVEEYVG